MVKAAGVTGFAGGVISPRRCGQSWPRQCNGYRAPPDPPLANPQLRPPEQPSGVRARPTPTPAFSQRFLVVLRVPPLDDGVPGSSQATPGIGLGPGTLRVPPRRTPPDGPDGPSRTGDRPSHSPSSGGRPSPKRHLPLDPRSGSEWDASPQPQPPRTPPPPPPPRRGTGPIRPTWRRRWRGGVAKNRPPFPLLHLLDSAGSQ